MNSKQALHIAQKFLMDYKQVQWDHLLRLINNVGILQHAKFQIPNYHHGYCLDDNCRALLLMTISSKYENINQYKHLIDRFFALIYYLQREDGKFINFLSFDLKFLEEEGSEDAFGRTIWTLGYLIAQDHLKEYHPLAEEIFNRADPHFLQVKSLRAVGYLCLGLSYYLSAYPNNEKIKGYHQNLMNYMMREYQAAANDSWHWYEKVIAYDNAILPFSLLKAAQLIQDREAEQIALENFLFLDKILFSKPYLSIIGNQEWYREGMEISQYGQQPIEVPSIMLLYDLVYQLTQNKIYQDKKQLAFAWFLGYNSKGLNLFDDKTKGCADGLEHFGINKNQGAESTLAFWTAFNLLK